MSRPIRQAISNSIGWNVPCEGNFAKTFDTPFPPAEYADYASLPVASSYEGCVAYLTDEQLVVMSIAGNWERLGFQAAYQANSTATIVSEVVTDFNALLAKLQTANLMASS